MWEKTTVIVLNVDNIITTTNDITDHHLFKLM